MRRGLFAGAVAGFALGFFLKLVEAVTKIKVYTLLLNVDFIPYMGRITFPEWVEFSFHLLVSLMIGACVAAIVHYTHWRPLFVTALLTTPTIFLYFPLSFLAKKGVPAPTDATAFFLWSLAHIGYMILFTYMYKTKASSYT